MTSRNWAGLGGGGGWGWGARDGACGREAAGGLHLPFDLLSDEKLAFAEALKLPTFSVDAMTLIKRLTLILRDGTIEKVFYPVFPPDQNADEVLSWLRSSA